MVLLVVAAALVGCKGPGINNLPPAEMMMHPGPGVDGPGPGVLMLEPPAPASLLVQLEQLAAGKVDAFYRYSEIEAAHLAPAAPGAREVLGPDLLRALRDPEHFVRLEAVRALGSIGPGRASGALRRAAGRDPMLGVAVEKALAGPS